MLKSIWLMALLATTAFAGCAAGPADSDSDGFPDREEIAAGSDPQDPLSQPGVTKVKFGDVTILAIVDSGFNPYHWDFSSEHMPQHMDDDPTNDLPLDQPPHKWIPGFPDPETFDQYRPLNLTLTPHNSSADLSCVPQDATLTSSGVQCEHEDGGLIQQDADEWAKVNRSNIIPGHEEYEVNYYYVPGTKVIGYINNSAGQGHSASSHGVGTTTVSVGNLHGSCPECLLMFINGYGTNDEANIWMANQDWIDVQSNSWGRSTGYRENIYVDCDLAPLQAGVERGQQIFWSAGNGQLNAFVAPVNTLNSCQKGPDFLVTVGAISPENDGSYTGHGKPVDVASFGRGYPSGYGGNGTVTQQGNFSGTSNAAPVNAGMFAKGLWSLRNEFGTPRIQEGGVIATGPAGCGSANPECGMKDGQVTVHELREAYFRAATPTDAAIATSSLGATDDPYADASTNETEYLNEGHGSFRGHLGDIDAEVQAIVDEVLGNRFDKPSQELVDYMVAYSYCSQEVWGHWEYGFWKPGDPLPPVDEERPVQSWYVEECPDDMNTLLAPFRDS